MVMEMSNWFPGVEYEFIEEYDREDLTDKVIRDNFDVNAYETKFGRPFSRPEMSLSMKFKTCFSKIANSSGEYFLVLEDDVIFKKDPIQYIKKILKHCSDASINFDCIFMGEAELRHGDNREGVFFKKEYPSTNGLCTVLYKKETIERLNSDLEEKPIVTQAFDWELNDRFRNLALEVYWADAITKHGSVIASREGLYTGLKSTLR